MFCYLNSDVMNVLIHTALHTLHINSFKYILKHGSKSMEIFKAFVRYWQTFHMNDFKFTILSTVQENAYFAHPCCV